MLTARTYEFGRTTQDDYDDDAYGYGGAAGFSYGGASGGYSYGGATGK